MVLSSHGEGVKDLTNDAHVEGGTMSSRHGLKKSHVEVEEGWRSSM